MRTRNIYLVLFISALMVGCDKPESSPELKDPIFLDLRSEESSIQKEIDTKLKELDDLKQTMNEMPDNDFQKKLTRDEIYRAKKEITKLEQKREYFRISKDSRQIFARKQYLEYYKAKKDWPPKDIKEDYFARKALSTAPKQWQRGISSKKTEAPSKK